MQQRSSLHIQYCIMSTWVLKSLTFTIALWYFCHPPTFFMFTHTPTFLPTSTHTHVQDGCTALLVAAEQVHEDVVQLLIEVDADPDLQDKVIHRWPAMQIIMKQNNWRAQNQSGLTNPPWISAGNINRSQLYTTSSIPQLIVNFTCKHTNSSGWVCCWVHKYLSSWDVDWYSLM